MNQGCAQLMAAPLLEELRLSLDYQVRQCRRSRSLEQKDGMEPPTANCCALGASSMVLPGLGCLVAGSRSTSLSFVSFLWDPECIETALGHEPKHRKWSHLGEWLLKCTPNTNKTQI